MTMKQVRNVETLEMKGGSKYRGTINRTKSGRLCQKWTSQTPQKHNFGPIGKAARGLGDHNYCRNPDKSANIVVL